MTDETFVAWAPAVWVEERILAFQAAPLTAVESRIQQNFNSQLEFHAGRNPSLGRDVVQAQVMEQQKLGQGVGLGGISRLQKAIFDRTGEWLDSTQVRLLTFRKPSWGGESTMA